MAQAVEAAKAIDMVKAIEAKKAIDMVEAIEAVKARVCDRKQSKSGASTCLSVSSLGRLEGDESTDATDCESSSDEAVDGLERPGSQAPAGRQADVVTDEDAGSLAAQPRMLRR
eukprot:CAMPEP_0168452316 /NCGR_PEP_ID=MMETSP0228-20121227/49089_1 /TAXON_ID=133427 /ORGANISM="Protoceratium reticulatum, Strain CCCM 535 (=CCMP 1889)" /LENGTH=113 /DNA_ID=CAMNT_0008466961 /DNA_START=6 /DNA_END=344 /DNA_ORIENTATION=-